VSEVGHFARRTNAFKPWERFPIPINYRHGKPLRPALGASAEEFDGVVSTRSAASCTII